MEIDVDSVFATSTTGGNLVNRNNRSQLRVESYLIQVVIIRQGSSAEFCEFHIHNKNQLGTQVLAMQSKEPVRDKGTREFRVKRHE